MITCAVEHSKELRLQESETHYDQDHVGLGGYGAACLNSFTWLLRAR